MTKPIRAVHDDDLQQFLANLGKLGEINAGKVHCMFCQTIVTLRTLHAAVPDSGSVKFVCDSPTCVTQLMDWLLKAE